ncbi:glycosyl hydrolase family 18 protein [Nocardiopsis baichengensis]|uniref:glycosyl hydrolase family 18 protein n=1 Tax=Nocardiopsis baichengensis TaxID=280240 RepID=UPI00034D2604|nr:glycosyl hydrolase family 18 protein [Nocardiopsis baichengensis]
MSARPPARGRIRPRGWIAAAAAALTALPLALSTAPASADAPAAAPEGVTVVYTEGSSWETGYSGQFTIDNASGTELSDWTIEVALPDGAEITSLWNAEMSRSGADYTLTPPSWGAPVPAGGTYQIGFNGSLSAGATETAPVSCTVNGSPCAGGPGEDDTEAPTAPEGLSVSGTTSSSVGLSWDASSDNVGVAGYEILSGGEPVRTVIGDTASGTVSGLDPDTEYTFAVRAFDDAGNRSDPSGEVTARTAEGGDPGGPDEGKRVGYFTQWGIYDRGYLVKDVDTSGTAERLTHINYAFANINDNGQCFQANQLGEGDAWADYGRSFRADESVDGVGDTWDQDLRGNFNQLRELKEKHPHLKVNLSIGGWTWSKNISDAASTPESRERMASSCIDMFLRGNLPAFDGAGGPGSAYGVFDGIDLDWEWPASEGHPDNVWKPEDKQNFTALVGEFRSQLDALETETGRAFELTSFMPADPAKVEAGFEVDKIMPDFDFITLQGYDYHGAWEETTAHQSNLVVSPDDPSEPERLFSGEVALDAWTSRGASPEDIVMGVPFYSRGWTGVEPGPNGDGMFQSSTGAAPGTYEDGIEDWKRLKDLPGQGYTLHRDEQAGAAWIYDGTTLWTFDDETEMRRKADWINGQGLGGAMVWSLDGDDSQGTLMRSLDGSLA